MTAFNHTKQTIAQTLALLVGQEERRYPDQRLTWITFGFCAKIRLYHAGQLLCV